MVESSIDCSAISKETMTHFVRTRILRWYIPSLLLMSHSSARNHSKGSGAFGTDPFLPGCYPYFTSPTLIAFDFDPGEFALLVKEWFRARKKLTVMREVYFMPISALIVMRFGVNTLKSPFSLATACLLQSVAQVPFCRQPSIPPMGTICARALRSLSE